MSTFNRMKSSTAVIAALAAGMVVLAATGHANAKDGNGSKGRESHGATVNSTAGNAAAKTTPTYTCLACRFVKRDASDKLERKSDSGHDKSGRDMSGRDMSDGDKSDHKMRQSGGKPVEATNGRNDLSCKGFVGCRVPKLGDGQHEMPQPSGKPGATSGGKPTGPVASTPGTPPGTPPAATPPLATVKISNGVNTSLLRDAPGGLLVTSTSPGTITVSNGTNSVTFPNAAVSLSGAVSVGAGAGVQAFREKNGDIVVVAKPPAPPAPTPAPPKLPVAGTVTGGPEGGFFGAIGSAIKDAGKDAGNAILKGAADLGVGSGFEAHPIN